MDPAYIATRFPPKLGFRRFSVTVENAIGDEATTVVYVPKERAPRQCAVGAIARARAVIPDERPFKVTRIVEL